MPRRNDEVFRAKLKEYERDMRTRGLSYKYIQMEITGLQRCARILLSTGLTMNPNKMTQEHLAAIRDGISGRPRNKQFYTEMLRRFLRFLGNPLPNFRWPDYTPDRPRVRPEDWATAMEGCYQANDIRGATVLLLESLSIRRVGITRLKPEDIFQTHILVTGKGRMGGKYRKIPITPEIYLQLQEYIAWRQREIKRVLNNNPQTKIPEKLIIWARVKAMGSCSGKSIDTIVKDAGRRVGVKLTNHPIRRMACRELYEAVKATGKPMRTAMEITGHQNEQVFMTYVGSIEDDARELIQVLVEQRNNKRGICL